MITTNHKGGNMPPLPNSLEALEEFLKIPKEKLIALDIDLLNQMREALAREDFMMVHMLGYKIK